ncbi:MAG: hypothetical protein HKN25_13175 [Pyrinomonadaceae bacterium]|nr:hypothetical protein [Pyrinomonadaceae bacterium]
MNISILKLDPRLLTIGSPLFIFLTATALAFTSLPLIFPELVVGIIIDLTISAPLLYLFLNRKRRFLIFEVSALASIGILVASFALPADGHGILDIIKFIALPAAEIGLLGFFAYSSYKTLKLYNSERGKNADVLTVLHEVSSKSLGDSLFARLVAYEASVIYYAFLSWRKSPVNKNAFTYHKKSGAIAVFALFAFLIIAETFVFHYLVVQINVYIAWLLTFSSLYALMLLLAHAKACIRRPIELTGDRLLVRYGLLGEAEIALKNIAEVETADDFYGEEPEIRKLAIFERCNTRIRLKEESTGYGFYRIKTRFQALVFFADDNEKLKKLLTGK